MGAPVAPTATRIDVTRVHLSHSYDRIRESRALLDAIRIRVHETGARSGDTLGRLDETTSVLVPRKRPVDDNREGNERVKAGIRATI
jgi:hypothetical protein